MKIILPKSSLLENLFPDIDDYSDLNEEDIESLKKYYSYGEHQPAVELHDDHIVIELDVESISKEQRKFEEVVSQCTVKAFSSALSGINELIDNNPLISEYHRLKGQILSEQGDNNEAIDELIEALRLDPENTSALIMLGNIYSAFRDDIETALNFYERVLELNPNDHLALNNIGSNLAKAGRLDDAERYLDLAHDVEPEYPNTIYGQALLASKKDQHYKAFSKAVKAFKYLDRGKETELFKQNLNLAQDEAVEYIKTTDSHEFIDKYVEQLEERSGKPIKIESSNNINTPAKLEIAEVHNREHHLVKYQPNRIAIEHLIMHELGHLDLALEARKEGVNKLFTTNDTCRKAFNSDNRNYIVNKLEKQGIPESKIEGFIDQIFNGLNSQIYNTPIDLFIEQRLHDKFSDLHPYQFMSLLKLEEEYIASATNDDIKTLVPKKVHQTNKILSLVNTIQFKDLYNLDLTQQFNPSSKEISEAEELYKEWIAYFNDDEAGVEYKLIEIWADDFGISEYFNLIDEKSYGDKDVNDQVNQIESDPLSLEDKESVGKESFSNEGSVAGEMSTTMYILDALKFFEDKSLDEIRKIGFEIGMLGRSGIDTNNPEKKYSLKAIPDKKFSGRHLLAYMYTAFQEFEPDLDTGLDFESEYEQAVELFNKGH